MLAQERATLRTAGRDDLARKVRYQTADANVAKGKIGGARLLSALTVFTDGSALRLPAAEGAPALVPACLSPLTQSAFVRSSRDLLHVHEDGEPKPVRQLNAQLNDGRLHFHRGEDRNGTGTGPDTLKMRRFSAGPTPGAGRK